MNVLGVANLQVPSITSKNAKALFHLEKKKYAAYLEKTDQPLRPKTRIFSNFSRASSEKTLVFQYPKICC